MARIFDFRPRGARLSLGMKTKIRFKIVTIFPEALECYFSSSILKRAREKKLIKVEFVNPRDFATDRHRTTDDKPFGGGPGMVMKAEPLARAIDSALKKAKAGKRKAKVVVFSPAGEQFTRKMARSWAASGGDLILVSGRYEGIDERVKKIFNAREISIGPYVLTGGELPAAVVADAVSRHVPGVLGKRESLEEERGVGIPVYTRPEVFAWPPRARGGRKPKKYRVPRVLLSGHHEEIRKWRARRASRGRS